ncbi:MAG: hypothetical protein HY235_01435 [Acidobacteria bacterium]|nr:hypothetical protein [Acidobacteriota bacterium]
MIKQHCNTAASRPGPAGLLALFWIVPAMLNATPPFGFSSQTFRAQLSGNVHVSQWEGPLFTLLIQSTTSPEWGVDVVPGTTEFAATDASGRPSQSGWHDHPSLLTIGIVIQGTVWAQEKPFNCLVPRPAGSVFFERRGEIHNIYNLDTRVPAMVRVLHFIDRGEASTRRDQPDPLTGDPSVASPPPPVCAPGASAAARGQWNSGSAPLGLRDLPFSFLHPEGPKH